MRSTFIHSARPQTPRHVGSVGQPRERTAARVYVILDTDAKPSRSAESSTISEATAAKIYNEPDLDNALAID